MMTCMRTGLEGRCVWTSELAELSPFCEPFAPNAPDEPPPKRPELAKELRRLENLSRQQEQTQIFIETPYRSQMVLEVALESLQATTIFGVAQDITGEAEFIRSLSIKDWNKSGKKMLEKLPGVFLIFAGNKEYSKIPDQIVGR